MVIHPKLLLDVLLVRQRKESPMDHGQLSMVADKFQWVFSETLLNPCGKDTKFCRRQRTITPFRLGLALPATCASHRVETLADCHRGFNALFDTPITYKAFYNQLAKPHFATFMGTMASRLIGELTLKVLAQFIGLCSSLKWSSPRTNSPFLALPASAGSNAAYKIISACSNAVS